jgi:antitoxin CcdA
MPNPILFNPKAPKKSANLTINSELLQRSKEFHINLSQALEQKLIELLYKKTKQQWFGQNKEALESYNRWVKKHGVFSEEMRKF